MELNQEQQKAVNCNDKKILCLACAGAGKTQVLISRLNRLIEEGVKPESILCLTFTRAAALEMRERFSALQTSYGITTFTKPEICTFHAFCYSLITHDPKVRRRIGYVKIPKILDPELDKKYQQEAIIQGNIKLPKKKLKKTAPRTKAEEEMFKLFEKAYKRLLMKDNFITFDKLCSSICSLFHFSDDVILPYKERYTHILVDEFQDTDYMQVDFIESFENASLFCVGDALQNLYSFRGTSNKYVKQYSQDPQWTKIRMNKNYRSTPQICEYANASSVYAEDAYRIELNSQKTDGVKVVDKKIKEKSDKWSLDAVKPGMLNAIHDAITPTHETAILVRTNAEVDEINQYLSSQNIDCSTSKKDFLSANLLKSAIDNEFLIDWLSTLLTSEKYANFIRLRTLEENPDVHWFTENFGHTYNLIDFLKVINNLRNIIIDAIKIQDSNENLVSNLLKALGLEPFEDFDCPKTSRRECINALIDKINQSKITEVYVGTVHSVKGLEFEDVIVANVDTKYFRRTHEDNQNIFYVAVTRAKDRLTVLHGE